MKVDFTDNSKKVLAALHEQVEKALEECGLTAEGYAKKLCPVDTGNLRNSISHTVSDDAAYIGTNSEYAPYVEFGTGKFAEGGRKTPWIYQDTEGHWHRTAGQKAQPYLKPAVADHANTYRQIIDSKLKNG